MLNRLDLSPSLDRAEYREKMDALMHQLRSLHTQCWQQRLTLIIVLEGWAAAGKGKMVKKLATCMDPRGFALHPIVAPTPEEENYPFLWRFWQRLPKRGNVALFYHSWYTHVLEDRLLQKVPLEQVYPRLEAINGFERELRRDRVGIAKFWIHLSKKELKKRLKKYANDPLDAWRVRPEDWQQHKYYKEYTTLAEEMISHTNTHWVPWTLIAGDCQRWARVQILSHIVNQLALLLEHQSTAPPISHPEIVPVADTPNYLSQVDLGRNLSKENYKKQLKHQQIELRKLQRSIYENNLPVLLLFEGWDAAGKGGAIKRLTEVLDPRSYQVHPFAAPTDEEKAHHYLWRFWRKLPPAGTSGRLCQRNRMATGL
jgi:polyphosphate kinase 2 (PPK2 family)